MFATRDLPTCKILIRKHAYIFMKSAAESRNVILHSIVRSDSNVILHSIVRSDSVGTCIRQVAPRSYNVNVDTLHHRH